MLSSVIRISVECCYADPAIRSRASNSSSSISNEPKRTKLLLTKQFHLDWQWELSPMTWLFVMYWPLMQLAWFYGPRSGLSGEWCGEGIKGSWWWLAAKLQYSAFTDSRMDHRIDMIKFHRRDKVEIPRWSSSWADAKRDCGESRDMT